EDRHELLRERGADSVAIFQELDDLPVERRHAARVSKLGAKRCAAGERPRMTRSDTELRRPLPAAAPARPRAARVSEEKLSRSGGSGFSPPAGRDPGGLGAVLELVELVLRLGLHLVELVEVVLRDRLGLLGHLLARALDHGEPLVELAEALLPRI